MFRAFLCVALAACVGLPLSAFEPQAEKPQILLKSGGSFLGIGVSEVDSERTKALNLREERGVEVTRVEDDGPAAKGGMKVGDVILEYNGQRVEGTGQLLRLVAETPPGREVKIGVSRSGALQTLIIRTGSKKLWIAKHGDPLRIEMPELMVPDVPKAFMTWRSAALGIEAESVEGQLAEFFGVKEGVLVRSVAKGSAAERAGVKAGDVITKVDATVVSTPKEITQVLRASKGRKDVALRIVRDNRDIAVNVPLEEDRTP